MINIPVLITIIILTMIIIFIKGLIKQYQHEEVWLSVASIDNFLRETDYCLIDGRKYKILERDYSKSRIKIRKCYPWEEQDA